MERPTLRFLAGLLAPGGVLVLATWAVQREEVVRSAAAPYAAYFCFGALAAGVLLSWYYDQSRLLCSASAVVLTVLALGGWATDSNMVKLGEELVHGRFAGLDREGALLLETPAGPRKIVAGELLGWAA